MGYFSEYAFSDYDNSDVSHETQLLMRLQDLYTRYEELLLQQSPSDEGVCFSRDELRYVLAGDIETTATVLKAIEAANEALGEQYTFGMNQESDTIDRIESSARDMQITWIDPLFSILPPLPTDAA